MALTIDFAEKVAVVTGGSGVLGGTLAEALALHGARTVVVYHRNEAGAARVVDRIQAGGGTAMAHQTDVGSRKGLETLLDATRQAYGRVDFLVNGAGGAQRNATTSPETPFFDLPEEALRQVMDMNYTGDLLACQVFARAMVEQRAGAILNIASVGAFRPLTRSVAYSAAKAAVVNLTQWLAVHLAQEYHVPIRVNALVPGFFLTDQNRFLLQESGGGWTERAQRILAHTPMGRLGQPGDLVGPALWLLSDHATFVNGTTVVVDGGLSAFGGV